MITIDVNIIWDNICNEFIPKLQTNKGLDFFAKKRAKFEGWVQVELCESLSKISTDVVPEKSYRGKDDNKLKRTDIVINDYAIELKTINTSYKTKDIDTKSKPITKNIDGIIDDINKLKKANYTGKAVIFIVFPLETTPCKEWNKHMKKILNELDGNSSKLRYVDFKFNNNINGKIYLGEVK